MKRLSALLFFVVLGAPLLIAQAAPDDTVVEEIIARVNNSIVTRADVRHAREQLLSELRQSDPATADQDAKDHEKDVLRDLIDQQLLLQKGSDLGITADTELVKRLDELRKQMHADSMEDMEKAAQAQGISFERLQNRT
jgi:peptidyl-prolyl cis-trans isomerase SurA